MQNVFSRFVWLNGALEDGQQTSGGTPPLAAEVQPGGGWDCWIWTGSTVGNQVLQGLSDKPCDEHLVALLSVLNTLLP